MYKIYRNGRLYDELDPKTHAVLQIVASYAHDMPNDHWTMRDERGEVCYEFSSRSQK